MRSAGRGGRLNGESDPRNPSAPEAISGADLVERVVESRIIHQGRYLTFRVDTVELADGRRSTRDIAGHPGAVAVVAIDAEDRVALVRQYRVPAEGVLLEIPAGGLDVHEDGTKEEPALAARRELEEETGLRAGHWEKFVEFYSAPGFTDELMHLYLATDLTPADPDGRLGPDSDEQLILEWLPFSEAIAAVERGEIRDAKSIVGLLWIERMRRGVATDTARPMPSGDTVTVRYKLDRSLVIHAGLVLGRRSWGSRIAGIALLVVALLPALWSGFGIAAMIAALPVIILAVLFLTGWFYAPVLWYLLRKRPDLMDAESTLTISDAGLDMHSPTSAGHVAWETFQRVTESDRLFFLDIGTGSIMLLPKAAFSHAGLGVFYRLLDRHGLLPKR